MPEKKSAKKYPCVKYVKEIIGFVLSKCNFIVSIGPSFGHLKAV